MNVDRLAETYLSLQKSLIAESDDGLFRSVPIRKISKSKMPGEVCNGHEICILSENRVTVLPTVLNAVRDTLLTVTVTCNQ
jgi:hypothetical protein